MCVHLLGGIMGYTGCKEHWEFDPRWVTSTVRIEPSERQTFILVPVISFISLTMLCGCHRGGTACSTAAPLAVKTDSSESNSPDFRSSTGSSQEYLKWRSSADTRSKSVSTRPDLKLLRSDKAGRLDCFRRALKTHKCSAFCEVSEEFWFRGCWLWVRSYLMSRLKWRDDLFIVLHCQRSGADLCRRCSSGTEPSQY